MDGALIALVGTNADCPADRRTVTTGELQAFAAEQKTLYAEIDARRGADVLVLFERIARSLLQTPLKRPTLPPPLPNDGTINVRIEHYRLSCC
jgi:hypothetical protein